MSVNRIMNKLGNTFIMTLHLFDLINNITASGTNKLRRCLDEQINYIKVTFIYTNNRESSELN